MFFPSKNIHTRSGKTVGVYTTIGYGKHACLDIQGQVRPHPMQEVYHQILQSQKVAKQNQQFPIAAMLTKSLKQQNLYGS